MKLSRRDKWETAGMVLWLVFLSVMAAVGHAIDYVELTLIEAAELYERLPASVREKESKTTFLFGHFAIYAAPEMELTLRWNSSLRATDQRG